VPAGLMTLARRQGSNTGHDGSFQLELHWQASMAKSIH